MNTLKKSLLIMALAFTSTMVLAHHMDQKTIADRTAPVGKVYRQGDTIEQPKAAIAVVSTAATGGSRTGESIYKATCSACHGTGAAGAPKFGDAAAWGPRAAIGIDALLKIATSGKGAMPPKGMCMDCSAEELKGTIEYILKNSK